MKHLTSTDMKTVIDCIDDSLKELINHVDYSIEENTLGLSTLARLPEIDLTLDEVKQFSSVMYAYFLRIAERHVDVATNILSQVQLTQEAKLVLVKSALLCFFDENPNDTPYD